MPVREGGQAGQGKRSYGAAGAQCDTETHYDCSLDDNTQNSSTTTLLESSSNSIPSSPSVWGDEGILRGLPKNAQSQAYATWSPAHSIVFSQSSDYHFSLEPATQISHGSNVSQEATQPGSVPVIFAQAGTQLQSGEVLTRPEINHHQHVAGHQVSQDDRMKSFSPPVESVRRREREVSFRLCDASAFVKDLCLFVLSASRLAHALISRRFLNAICHVYGSLHSQIRDSR